jgi:hypothetical protein
VSYAAERRLLSIGFFVDTNCVNSRGVMVPMNQLETWASNRLFQMLTTEVAQNEMLAGADGTRRAKAYSFIFTMSAISTDQERQHLAKIGRILFPHGIKSQNERNDVEIAFNAGKYHRTLITNDGASKSQPGGILGNREQLAEELGIRVMNPGEAVEYVRREIAFRDENARRMAALTGTAIPEWVGKD